MMAPFAPVETRKAERSPEASQARNVDSEAREEPFALFGKQQGAVLHSDVACLHPAIVEPDADLAGDVVVTHPRLT